MAAAHQIDPHILAGPHQIAQLLLGRRRHPHQPQLVGQQQPRQPLGVARIGLDPSPACLGMCPGEQTTTSRPRAGARRANP